MNGNARTPLACCTVGRASNSNWAKPYSEQDLAALSGGVFVPSNTNTAPTQVQPAQGRFNSCRLIWTKAFVNWKHIFFFNIFIISL